MIRCLTLAAAVVVTSCSSPANACEAVERSREQTRQLQRHLAAVADSIYLARATPAAGRIYMSTYDRMVVIDGETPPRRLTAWPEDCGEADSGLTVVFAQRANRRDYPWQFWHWGDWVVTAFYPSEIADPDMIARLRRTADRLDSGDRR